MLLIYTGWSAGRPWTLLDLSEFEADFVLSLISDKGLLDDKEAEIRFTLIICYTSIFKLINSLLELIQNILGESNL